jgi:hypothetical protein
LRKEGARGIEQDGQGRRIGPFMATCLVVGTMIGSGI